MTGSSSSLSDFNEATLLGEGAYSAVYRVIRKADGKTYALKKVKLPSLNEKEKQNALNEVRLLASVQHPAIITFKEAFFDSGSKCLCIVQEFADSGDLYHKIVQQQKQRMYMRENEVWRIFLGICMGLNALHGFNICWRDCKSANVFLFQNGLVKIADFNVSKVAKRGLMYTQTGTPYFASPEIWKDAPYDAKADIWSLGCVLFECATLRPPFRAEDMEGLYRKVIRGVYPKIPACYSQDLADVIAMLIKVDPLQRPTVAQILNSPVVLRHIDEAPKYDASASSLLSASSSSVNTGGSMSLLQTIKMPKNATDIPNFLPEARYDDTRVDQSESPTYTRPLEPITTRREPLPRRQLPAVYSKASLDNEGSTGATSLPSAAPPVHAPPIQRKQDMDRHGPSVVDRYIAGFRRGAAERRPDPEAKRGGQSSLGAAQALYGGVRPVLGRGNLPPAVAHLIGGPSALPALYARQPPRQPRRLPGMPGI